MECTVVLLRVLAPQQGVRISCILSQNLVNTDN